MHVSSVLCIAPLLFTVATAANQKCAGHRRHHKPSGSSAHPSVVSTASDAGSSVDPVNLAIKTRSSRTSSWSDSASAPAATPTSKGPSGSSPGSWGLAGLNKASIYFGVLPDDGSGGGSKQSLRQLQDAAGTKFAAQGWYAQARSGVPFDGSQFNWRKEEIIAAGGVFQPAVMPTGGWQGLTYKDNSQAVRICQVMKDYTDEGLEVWLRFAHEVNWYLRDGTYSGSREDFKEGWDVVAKACRKIAPKVKMWFTPNVDSDSAYDDFFPDDISTVDLIGIDYYPRNGDMDFVARMKNFHDKYTSETCKFAIGETGYMENLSLDGQLKWAKHIMSQEVATALPNYIAMSWFNYDKEQDFRIIGKSGDWATKDWLTKQ